MNFMVTLYMRHGLKCNQSHVVSAFFTPHVMYIVWQSNWRFISYFLLVEILVDQLKCLHVHVLSERHNKWLCLEHFC